MSRFHPVALECFAVLIEEGSFERAARRLSITQSAVSQRLRTLEGDAGTVLVVRSRPLKLTATGEVLLKHANRLRLARSDFQRDAGELKPAAAGTAWKDERVAIALDADSIATWALPALDGLARRGLSLELFACPLDRTRDRLRDGEVMGCITSEENPPAGCKSMPAGAVEYLAVAQAAYASEHLPGGLGKYNFSAARFVACDRKDGLAQKFVHEAFGMAHARLGECYVPTPEGRLRAVCTGWGVGILPEALVREPLALGQLLNVAPRHRMRVRLYWQCWNAESSVLDALGAALVSPLPAPRSKAPARHPARRDEALAAAIA
jgi:LysR family transcriptional regulator, chromosome initiation inhibitor